MAADAMGRAPSGLAVRVIPCLDVRDGRTVKGTRFAALRDAGDPVELAARYSDEGADELVLLDIGATPEGRGMFLSVVRDVARAIGIPFTVGGGIASVDDAARALDAGADKVSLNTAIVLDPDLIGRVARRIGSQAVVAAMDVVREGGRWGIRIRGGSEPAGLDASAWAMEAVERGAGELLVTSMDRDGTRDGYDLDLLRALSGLVDVPVIASGGAGSVDHLVDAVGVGRADAVLLASILHYGEMTIAEIKSAMRMRGVEVRG